MMDKPYKLAKVADPIVIIASAVSQEYGARINAVAQSIGSYPSIGNLVPLIMFVTGLLLSPKAFMYQRFGDCEQEWRTIRMDVQNYVPSGRLPCSLPLLDRYNFSYRVHKLYSGINARFDFGIPRYHCWCMAYDILRTSDGRFDSDLDILPNTLLWS
jgi:hypothetical protein